jgi:hypothetical protein
VIECREHLRRGGELTRPLVGERFGKMGSHGGGEVVERER